MINVHQPQTRCLTTEIESINIVQDACDSEYIQVDDYKVWYVPGICV